MLQKNKFIQVILSFLVVFSLTLSLVQYTPVAAQGKDGVRREHNAQTGKVNFIGSDSGLPLKAAQALGIPAGGKPPVDPARALVQKYGRDFGLNDPANELMQSRSKSLENGRLNVRYQQTYQGVPVFAGGLIVNTNDAGDLYSINGEVATDLSLSTEPSISLEDAQATALQVVAKIYEKTTEDFVSTQPELWVYDSSLVTPETRPAALVWRMEVTPAKEKDLIRQLILVDAQTGHVVFNINQVDTAWTVDKPSKPSLESTSSSSAPLAYPPLEPFGAPRITWDALNGYGFGVQQCNNQLLSCTDGVNADADNAHRLAGLVWALYNEKHGRDSMDDGGMSIVSVVHYAVKYLNAGWDGYEMVYGDGAGFAGADDVIGHELTHGVTQYESDLLYAYQSGAINESLSDIWGEYLDQTDGYGNDTDAVKWLMGEDITGLGAIRSMKNPPQFGDPDKMTSSLYYKGYSDNGGVHWNSGVNNKAAYLMVDGATFNGKTVRGIGWDKTAAIYYEAQTNLLGNGTNYSDLYYALQQACTTLTGGALGITSEDCISVKDALDAVQMNSPINLMPFVTAPLCQTGLTPGTTLFEDDMELGPGANWNTTPNWYPSPDIASSPIYSMYGDDYAPNMDESATMKTGVLIQPHTFLHFDHLYDFEYYGGPYAFDGGRIEYSADGGQWLDAAPFWAAGANYGPKLLGGALAGQKAFTGSTWLVSSRYNLSSLAGKTVKFRFRYSTDSMYQWYGWYIDDVKIYTCVGLPNVPVLQSPLENELVTDYTPKLDWADTVPAANRYHLQLSADSSFTTVLYEDENLTSSEFTIPANLDENAKYYWRVRAFNSLNVTNDWSATRSFRTALLSPILASPTDGSSPHTVRPTFTWINPSSGPAPTSYTIQVASDAGFSTIVHTGTSTTTSYTPAVNLPANDQLYWHVRANGTNGPSLYSTPVLSFFTPQGVPSAPTMVAPATGALTTDYSPALSWSMPSTSPAFDHFIVQVDNNSDFSSPEEEDLSVLTSPFSPSPDLASDTKFYWRVRAVNGSGEMSNWSAVRNFRTALMPPVLISPADDTPVTSLRPTFTWNPVPNATGYAIQISKNSTFTMIVTSGSTVSTSFTPTVDMPKNGVTLYWRVQTKGLNGPSAWTPAVAADRTFTTPLIVPSAPTLTSPATGALTTDYTPNLSWTMPATSPTYDHFIVQVDDDLNFISPDTYDPVAAAPFTTPALAPDKKYYWRVRAANGTVLGNWSAVRNFRTALVPPTLTAPTLGETVTSLRPTFTWDSVPNATGYAIQISKNNTFTLVILTASAATNQFTPTVDLPKNNTSLYWRVQTKGLNGPSAWTELPPVTRSFITPVNPPSTPTLVAPATGALLTDYTPGLSWAMPATSSAFDHFIVQVDDNFDFISPEVQDLTVGSSPFTTMDLTPNKKYYWRVRAVSDSGELSNWSAVRNFRTALEAPVLLTPTTGSPVLTLWPTFDWNDVTGAGGYVIQISKTASFASTKIIVNAKTISSAYSVLSKLPRGIVLYWRVRATGPNGATNNWSVTYSFTTP